MPKLPAKLYSISAAAHLLGIHPSTLRLWEKQNLVSPQRTSSGERVYTAESIEKLIKNGNKRRSPLRTIPPPPSNQTTEQLNHQSHFSFSSGQLLILLAVFLLLGSVISIGAVTFLYPKEAAKIAQDLKVEGKESVLNPIASFLLSGGARVEGTARFLSDVFFGETDSYFISPLGDARFRSLITSSLTTDHLTVTRSQTIAGLNADFLDGQDGSYYLSWNNFTNRPVVLSSLDNVSNNEGNIDLLASGNITITPNDSAKTITFAVPATAQGEGSGLNADFLDSLDSTQFLRSDASDSFSSGTLTFGSGTTLSLSNGSSLIVAGSASFSGSLSTGTILPLADDTHDLGSTSLRWRDLFLGPTSLHLLATAGETTTARDWKLAIQETGGASEGNLRILEGANELLNITPTGNVGIGTADPTSQLHLGSGALGAVNTVDGLAFGYSAGVNFIQATRNGANNGEIILRALNAGSANANQLYLSFTGNVGIGVNPANKLSVNGSAKLIGALSTTSVTLGFGDDAGTFGWSIGNGIIDSTHNFRIYDNTAGLARVTVDGNGNVGIGATSPNQKLEVAGTSRLGSNSTDYIELAGGSGTTTISAAGGSTNVNINLTPKGSGTLQYSGTEIAKVSILDSLLYGDGSDGAVTISANTNLTRDMYYSSLTVNSGIILRAKGHKVHVKGTLLNNGTISADGGTASDGAQGNNLGAIAGSTGGGTNGAIAGGDPTPTGTNATQAEGGAGGAGGGGAVRGGGAGGTVTRGPEGFRHFISLLSKATVLKGGAGGGAGGDDPNPGGSGGGGGGVLIIAAKTLNNGGTIRANGADGAPENGASSGGGGGGGGGFIAVAYNVLTALGTLQVNGGAGGAASPGTPGNPGSAGTVVQFPINNTGADLAENYNIVDDAKPGDVVHIDPSSTGPFPAVSKATSAYDPKLAGIIATNPGIILSDETTSSGNISAVALAGRVPTNVTTENGVIKAGDYLTSSATKPGYAMKATKAGRTIGIALDGFSCADADKVSPCQGKVMVFVNLSWYDPDAYLTDTGEYVISRADQIVDKVSPYPSTGEETDLSGCDKVSPCQEPIGNQPGGLSSPPIYELRTLNSELITRIGAYNSLFVANLQAGSLDVSEIILNGKNLLELLESKSQIDAEGDLAQINADGTAQKILTSEVEAETGIFQTLTSTVEAIFDHVKAQTLDVAGKLTAKTAQITEAIIGKLTVNDLSVGEKARINKLEMVDQVTGKIYCAWIADGEWIKEEGVCPTP